jgi:short-subunit dehydrogenase
MPGWYANQVVIITGASSGIGWAVASLLGEQGANLGLIARRRDKLQELAAQIHAKGASAAIAPADVGNREQTTSAVAELIGRLGPPDLVIANAGVGVPTLLEPANVPAVEQMFRVNVLGMVYTFEAVLPLMLARGRGHLAGISSLASYKGLPGESGYCASKAAMNVYLEGLRIRLRGRGIDVTTICPGFVRTPMTAVNKFPMPGLMDADVAARRIVRALWRRKKVYDFPWHVATMTKLMAWLPDWCIARLMQGYNENPPMPEESAEVPARETP